MLPILVNALRETLYMVLYSTLLSLLIGLPLGVLIANISESHNRLVKKFFTVVHSSMLVATAIPYLLVMLLFIPMTNWLINHNVNFTTATIIPLSTAGSLLLALKVFEVINVLKDKWRTTTKAMGANNQQSFWLIFLPEGLGSMVHAAAQTSASIVSFSIIAGAFGAGGLGQLAIEKTITEPNYKYALVSIVLLVAIQQLIKYTGYLVVPQRYS
jgi:D-methionine transport system permease protein